LPSLFDNTFHPDEALFATWARLIASWQDPLLLTQQVDKPPLLFYLQALHYPLQGAVEWAARLPSFIASLLLVPLIAIVAWRVYRDELTSTIAAFLVALSPYAIQFSATAFTDPLLTTLLIASLACVVGQNRVDSAGVVTSTSNRRAVRLAGLLFGLAVATKYQAWLFLPLFVAIARLFRWRRTELLLWLSGFLPIFFSLTLWERLRAGGFSLWPAQFANFGGLRLIWSWELWPRFQQLAHLGRWLIATPAYFLMLPLLLLAGRRKSHRARHFDLLCTLFLAGYLMAHWLIAVPLWDRYLLSTLPILALLLARATVAVASTLLTPRFLGPIQSGAIPVGGSAGMLCSRHRSLGYGFLALFMLFQLPTARAARLSAYPIGGRPSADQGTALVAAKLYDAPYGTVLYDHWYSWQWRYQLLSRRVYVSWFPHPAALAQDLLVFADDRSSRFLALPHSPAALPVKRAISEAGFWLQALPVAGESRIGLYRILPQGADR
jgi:hypothetical protein